MLGGGVWVAGEWTDDTGMALAVAEGILEAPADPVSAIGRNFLEWRRMPKTSATRFAGRSTPTPATGPPRLRGRQWRDSGTLVATDP